MWMADLKIGDYKKRWRLKACLRQAAPTEIDAQSSGVDGRVGRELGTETPLEFLAEFGDFHAGHDDKLASDHFTRFIIIGKLTGDAAILAILIPAEAAVGDRFRADKLKTTKQGVAFRNLEFFSENRNFNEFFVRTERFRHDGPTLCKQNPARRKLS